MKAPKSLLEATRLFSTPEKANDYFVQLRWPDGVIPCPKCTGTGHYFLSKRLVWKCKGCGKQFSVKAGTIFEDSPLGLDKWLIALWLITNAKNGISSCELARALEVQQRTAWFMNHRIRLAMSNGTFEKLEGTVEVDESYFGGKKKRGKPGRGASGKVPVVGAVERGGRITVMLSQKVGQNALTPFVAATVKQSAKVYTDEWSGYGKLSAAGFAHRTINHKTGLYVDGDIHTQNIEAFWSLMKRGIKGTYVSVEPIHLGRYADEFTFRFNERGSNDGQRFLKVAGQVEGKRITYAKLTGRVSQQPAWR